MGGVKNNAARYLVENNNISEIYSSGKQ